VAWVSEDSHARGRDYQFDGVLPVPDDLDEGVDNVVVMPQWDTAHGWEAVWFAPGCQKGEFTGTRDQAVAWARSTGAPLIHVYSVELGDVVVLPDVPGEGYV